MQRTQARTPSFARSRAGRGRSRAHAQELDALESYLREIGPTPTLTRREESELGRGIEEHGARRRRILFGVPGLADFVTRRRDEIRHAGRLPITMSAIPPAERDAAARRGFDAALESIARLSARRLRGVASGRLVSASTRERLRREIRRALSAARLAPDVLDEAEAALQSLAAEMERRRHRGDLAGVRQLEGEAGLDAREFADAMAAAAREREAATELRNRFAHHNLKLVVSMARQFQGMNVALPDLIQEANVGLMRAVEKFDHRRGTKFSTYAAWWIRQSLVRAVQKQSRDVRLPSHVFEAVTRRERVRARMAQTLGRIPNAIEVAQEAGLDAVSQDRLDRVRHEVSLETPVGPEGGLSLGQCLADPQSGAPDEVDGERLVPAVRSLLPELDEREQSVLERRFGLGSEDPKTLQEVGESLGISRERARQLQMKALEGLRRVASERGLGDFLESQVERERSSSA